jgi:hypothetical protein
LSNLRLCSDSSESDSSTDEDVDDGTAETSRRKATFRRRSPEELMPTQEELRAAGLLDPSATGTEADSGPDLLNANAAPSRPNILNSVWQTAGSGNGCG